MYMPISIAVKIIYLEKQYGTLNFIESSHNLSFCHDGIWKWGTPVARWVEFVPFRPKALYCSSSLIHLPDFLQKKKSLIKKKKDCIWKLVFFGHCVLRSSVTWPLPCKLFVEIHHVCWPPSHQLFLPNNVEIYSQCKHNRDDDTRCQSDVIIRKQIQLQFAC